MEKCYIVTVICLTLIVLAYIGNKKGKKQEKTEVNAK